MTLLLATGTLPQVLFPLLDALRERDPMQVERIEDRFSLVLRGIKEDEIKDWEMVTGLLEVLTEAFTLHAPEGLVFGRIGLAWGYWPSGPE